MSRIDVEPTSRLWCEEMNRIRHEIQQRWTQAQRSYRRQVALYRQQELARLLRLIPAGLTSPHPKDGQTNGQRLEESTRTLPRPPARRDAKLPPERARKP